MFQKVTLFETGAIDKKSAPESVESLDFVPRKQPFFAANLELNLASNLPVE